MQFEYNDYILIIEEIVEIDQANHYRATCSELNYYSSGFWNTNLETVKNNFKKEVDRKTK